MMGTLSACIKDCNVSACIWLNSSLGLRARNHSASNMQTWIEAMMGTLSAAQTEEFFMVLWAIWLARNDVLWNGKMVEPARVIHNAMQLLNDY